MNQETALEGVKLAPGQKAKLSTQISQYVKDRLRRRKQSTEVANLKASNSTLMSAGVSAIGGAVAEEVRRNVVGSVTDDVRGQGIGLIAAGSLVHLVGKKYGIVGQVGTAHCAYGGAMLAASFHGGKKGADDEDPLAFAFRATTRKYKSDKKEKK